MKNNLKKKIIIIGIQLLIASGFIVGADWAGENAKRLFHSYYADIVLPFGYYFLLMLADDYFSFLRPWYTKAIAVFLLVSTSEVLQFFGIYALAYTFDPFDFLAYGFGVICAVFIDIKIFSRYIK